jgi:hypothetical protein
MVSVDELAMRQVEEVPNDPDAGAEHSDAAEDE